MRQVAPYLLITGLSAAVLASSVGVIYAKHQSRKLFVELQILQGARDEINVEWGQLQLEQSTLATHAMIDHVARTKLGMVTPAPQDVVILRGARAPSTAHPAPRP